MPPPHASSKYLLLVVLGWGWVSAGAGEPLPGRLTAPQPARVVVEKIPCDCESQSGVEADALLVTLGTESFVNGERRFHPIVSLAFDRLLAGEEPGQWVAMWNLGLTRPGWRRTLRSLFPVPARPPKASEKELARLVAELERLRSGAGSGRVPQPYTDLGRLKPATAAQGAEMGIKRVLNWLDLFNPGQLLLRTFLLHRADRDERAFQRAYLGLAWLVDVEYAGGEPAAWLGGVNDVRFHLLRNRSFFGRWVPHSESFELVYSYDSHVREALAKGSSWLQADANEYHLRYEPVHRFTANGATVPVGGILYYEPRIAPAPEQARWPTPNVFDLAYNPFTHPEIQRRARENPEQWIPLALYGFQSELGLRPIILADFLAPNNPRLRESTQQAMTWLREWLLVSAGFLSPERFAYTIASFIANKKAFTPLVNKSARLGIEEMRLALESHLYFDPAQRGELMRGVDRRVQNPLVRAAEIEELRAKLDYEALRGEQARAVCQVVNRVRWTMARRFRLPATLTGPERWTRMRAELDEWQARRRIRDLLGRGVEELGALAALDAALRSFEAQVASQPDSAEVLRTLYTMLLEEQLRMPAGERREELVGFSERARRAWAAAEATRGRGPEEFERLRARIEATARARREAAGRKQQQESVEHLREFLGDAHESLSKAGCAQSDTSPAEAEMYLDVLLTLPEALAENPALAREFPRHERRLARDLARLKKALEQCPGDGLDPWRPEQRQATLVLVRAAGERLFPTRGPVVAGGEK